MKNWLLVLMAIVLLGGNLSPNIMAAFSPFSQSPQEQESEGKDETLRIQSEVVLVNVVVTDLKRQFINNLTRADFEIYEDGKLQEVSFFAQQDQPLSLGILIDASTSMLDSGKLEEAKKAVSILLARSNARDEAFLMKFDDKTTILQDFTTDFNQLNAQIDRVRPFGGTAIYDALIHGMEHIKKRGRRLRQALVLITDGLDQHSRKTLKDVLPLAQVTGVPCYVIGLYTSQEQEVLKKGEKIRLDTGQLVDNPMIAMSKLAEETAGRLYIPNNEKELVPIAIEIVNELRNAYVLGYYPPLASLDGKYHQISVASKGKKYSVRSRRGYISRLPQD